MMECSAMTMARGMSVPRLTAFNEADTVKHFGASSFCPFATGGGARGAGDAG